MSEESSAAIREASGSVDSSDRVVALLYTLLRDHVQPGVVAEVVNDLKKSSTFRFSNGWLARYAEYLATDLRTPVMKSAMEWQVIYPGIIVMDPDGWRGKNDSVTMETPITEEDYWRRVAQSTCDWSKATPEERDRWKNGYVP